MRFRFHARQVRVHSPLTASNPRTWNRRNPITSLIIPNTGSTVDLMEWSAPLYSRGLVGQNKRFFQ